MPLDADITIENYQQVQDANLRRLAALQPKGALGRALQAMVAEAHLYAVSITPVDTGSWRASQLTGIDLQIGEAWVYVSPSHVNVRSGDLVIDYATEWEDEGGAYAVYKRTAEERGQRILNIGRDMVLAAVRSA